MSQIPASTRLSMPKKRAAQPPNRQDIIGTKASARYPRRASMFPSRAKSQTDSFRSSLFWR